MLDVICPVNEATVAVKVAQVHKAVLDRVLALSSPVIEETLLVNSPDETVLKDALAPATVLSDPTVAFIVPVNTAALIDAVLMRFSVVPVMKLKVALLPACRGAVLVPVLSCPALI